MLSARMAAETAISTVGGSIAQGLVVPRDAGHTGDPEGAVADAHVWERGAGQADQREL